MNFDPKKEKFGPYDRLAQVYSLYVGHVTNSIGILAMLNNLDRQCLVSAFEKGETFEKCRQLPNPSSTINIELLAPKDPGTEYRIRVKLNDEFLNIYEDKSKAVSDNTYSFSEFKSIVMKNVVLDWYKKCDIGYESRAIQIEEYDNKNLYFIYLIAAFDACLLLLVLVVLLRSCLARGSLKSLK